MMNKKEAAEFAALKRELTVSMAFRFTEAVAPDVPIPVGMELSKGYLFHAGTSSRVEEACSSSVYHGFGRNDKTTSQQPRRLFSTKERALRALRHELEKKFANELANVDDQITEAIAEQGKEK